MEEKAGENNVDSLTNSVVYFNNCLPNSKGGEKNQAMRTGIGQNPAALYCIIEKEPGEYLEKGQ